MGIYWVYHLLKGLLEGVQELGCHPNGTTNFPMNLFKKKQRPFNHIFGGDTPSRMLRAWYRGIKNAGPRKRAQGRVQDIPYHHITISPCNLEDIYWMWQKKHARKSTQGRSARGRVLSYQKVKGIFDNPLVVNVGNTGQGAEGVYHPMVHGYAMLFVVPKKIRATPWVT